MNRKIFEEIAEILKKTHPILKISYHDPHDQFFCKGISISLLFSGCQIQKRSSPNSTRRKRGQQGYMVKFSSISSVPWYTYGPKAKGTSSNLLLT